MLFMQWHHLLTFAFLAVISRLLLTLIRTRRLRKLMPPGPAGIPLLGNVLEVPTKDTWKKFRQWKCEYGPTFSLNMAGQPVVVLNSLEAVTDLLDRRSAIYGDRPRLPMVNDILSGGINLAFMPYGDLWRKYRRVIHEIFNSHAAQSFEFMQKHESMSLIPLILKDPERWENHIEKFAASSVLCATYGWSLFDSPDRDQTLENIAALNCRLSHAAVPGNFLVNVFPILMRLPIWFPGARWKRDGLEVKKRFDNLFMELVDEVEIKLKGDGTVEHCLTAKLIESEGKYGLDRRETAWLSGIMLAAGAEATAGTLCIFVLAMTLHPDVQQRAHAELDSIVGRDRAPTFEDRPDLPYIDAVVKEVLRWRPPAPIGVARRCTQDDWYHGYLIPKGATIFQNIWAISHDPELFPDPEEFRPSRFLHLDKKEQLEVPDGIEMGMDKLFAFGCGRRICPGQYLAYNSLFIAISTLLWVFDVTQTLDENGNRIVPERTAFFDTGLAIHPLPFKCQIKPRFSGVQELVDLHISK